MGYAVRVGILHRKADVVAAWARGVGLLHGYRSRLLSLFFSPAQPTFLCCVIFLLRSQRPKLLTPFIFVLMGTVRSKLLFPTDADICTIAE